MRYVLLLPIAAAALGAPPIAAHGAQPTNGRTLVLQGKCTSAGDKACALCNIALTRDLAAPAGDRVVAGSCPKMATGRYRLEISVPLKIIPAQPAAPIFAQLQASFGATARNDASGNGREILPETPPASWSWWGPGAVIARTMPVTLAHEAAVDVTVKLADVRYFVPRRIQGPAHRDGELVVQKSVLVRLEGMPQSTADGDLGAPREFGAKTLAEIVPGRTTKAQVAALLGEPWRTVAADPDESEPEVWEYRGKDASGLYRVHIEFDDRGTTTLIVTVPDKTHSARAKVAKAPGKP